MSSTEDSAFARVECPVHGSQGISRRNYHAQMIETPDLEWQCPICGADSKFDHEYFQEHHEAK